ncbi:MAG: hypothetical protein HC912_05890 [Saprospiraceae bacterium]|nr:hypothetical protein [Saprospiraceae bacterium]
MVTIIFLSLAGGLVVALVLLIVFLPDKVQYIETITVKPPFQEFMTLFVFKSS